MNRIEREKIQEMGYNNHYKFLKGESYFYLGESNFFLGYTEKSAMRNKKILQFGVGNFNVEKLCNEIFGNGLKNHYEFILAKTVEKEFRYSFIEMNKPKDILPSIIVSLKNLEQPQSFGHLGGWEKTRVVFYSLMLQATTKEPPKSEMVLKAYERLEFKNQQTKFLFESLISYLDNT